jgi:hypothetical protein
MADFLPTWLARYRRWERTADIGFWTVILTWQVVFNSVVSWLDLRRFDPTRPFWQPALWELTSTMVVGALIPAIVWWERRHPIRLDTLPGCIGWHIAGSIGFTALHVAGLLALRKLSYAAIGRDYPVGDLVAVFGYEYLKDVRTYALVLLAVLGWRFLLLRMQGEARVLDPAEPPAGAPPTPQPAAAQRPERFLVRKLRKEFLVAANDIEWLQAQGNYLGLRVNGHDYLLRSTLSDFLEQLDSVRFTRVHRSWAVNLDRIAEIEPLDTGDARLKMKDGSLVPCSRRYREALGAAA